MAAPKQNKKKNATAPPAPAAGPQAVLWGPLSEQLDERLVALLRAHGVSIVPTEHPRVVYLRAVPLPAGWSKPRTNLLIEASPVRASAYVDADLEVTATGKSEWKEMLTGRVARDWRQLGIAQIPGPPGEVLCSVLELVGSPIAGRAREIQEAAQPAGGGERPSLGRMLDVVGEVICPETAAAAYRTCFRKKLADQVAVISTRPAAPHSAVLWGPSGCGLGHLLLAAAHPLFERGSRSLVVRVCCGKVIAGSIFPADADAALMRMLFDAVALEDALLLLEDFDLCLGGSRVGRSLFCNAIDQGLRVVATTASERRLAQLGDDAALVRRLAAVSVGPPTYREVAGALRELAKADGVDVSPAAVQAVLNASRKDGRIEPGASMSLLGAAIADVLWRKGTGATIHPDDVSAVPPSEWPQEEKEE